MGAFGNRTLRHKDGRTVTLTSDLGIMQAGVVIGAADANGNGLTMTRPYDQAFIIVSIREANGRGDAEWRRVSMKWAVILVAAVVILVVGGIALARRFSMFDCRDVIKQKAASFDRKFTAAVVERDCGATADYSTLVFVRRAEALSDLKRSHRSSSSRG